jgi:hypothetical protein
MTLRTQIWLAITTAALGALVVTGCSSSSNGTYSPVITDSGAPDSRPATDSGAADSGSAPDSGHVQDSGSPPDATDSEAPDEGPSYDFACGGKNPCLISQQCCAAPAATTTFSCTGPGVCSSTDVILCDGPDECGGAKPVCCAVEATNAGGSYPNCTPSALGTSCTATADCNTHLGTSCTETTSVVLCHVNSDCTDPNNPKCCTFGTSAASLTFCIDATTALLGGGNCM